MVTDTTPGLGMHVKVSDPEGKVIMDKNYGSKGKFAFTTHTPGSHKMCIRYFIIIMIAFFISIKVQIRQNGQTNMALLEPSDLGSTFNFTLARTDSTTK